MLPTVYPRVNRLWLWYIIRPYLPFFVRTSKLKSEPTKKSNYNLGYLQHSDMAAQAYARAVTELDQN